MKFNVTKRQVIKALNTEPLMGGAFVHSEDFEEGKNPYKNNSKCAVCAVGAVMDFTIGKMVDSNKLDSIARSLTKTCAMNDSNLEEITGDVYYDKRDLGDAKKVAKKAASMGLPMSGLSILFEHLMDVGYYSVDKTYRNKNGTANAKAREILINFVKSNFPSTIKIDTKKEY